MVDLYGESAYYEWSRTSAHDLYDRPLLRHLIKLLSPTLLVMGARSRWGAVRKGSSLSSGKVQKEGERVRTQVTLTHKEGVYVDVFFGGLVHAFEVALESSRGKNAKVSLLGRTPTTASYQLSWAR
jgi:hypothetical protein